MESKRFISHFIFFTALCALPMYAAAKHDEYIVLTQADCENSLKESETSKNTLRLFNHNYRQTTSYTCGSAVVMILMRYFGRFNQADMNSKTELRIAQEMGTIQQGTTSAQMAEWLSQHGFRVEHGMRISSALIIENLKKGIPTIIAMNNHWIVAKGFNQGSSSEGTTIYFADSSKNTTIISASDIDSLWMESQSSRGHSASRGEYIVAVPI